MLSTDRLTIVGRLTPHDRATFGRYDEKIFKQSADHQATIVRRFGSVNETFNLGASTKSRRPTIKYAKIGADVGRRRPIFPFLAH